MSSLTNRVLTRRAAGNRAPAFPFELNPDSPKAGNIIAAWATFGGRFGDRALNLLTGKIEGSKQGTGTMGYEPSSIAQREALTVAAATKTGLNLPDIGSVTAPVTFVCAFKADTYRDFGGVFAHRTGTSSDQTGMIVSNTNPKQLRGVWNNLGWNKTGPTVGTDLYTVGAWQAETSNNTLYAIDANGVRSTNPAITTGTDTLSELGLLMDESSGDTVRWIDGEVYFAVLYQGHLPLSVIESYWYPETRWDLVRQRDRRTFVFPAKAGAAARTLDLSLEAAVRRQVALTADLDGAVRAVRSAQATLQAALLRAVETDAGLSAALRTAQALSAALGAALRRAAAVTAALDASLAGAGGGFVLASLDSALRRLLSVSGAVDAALQGAPTTRANLDAVAALGGEAAALLDAVAKRVAVLVGLGLDAGLRGTPNLSAALDAAVGSIVLPGRGRTAAIPGRGAVFDIPPGNRRH